jgi:uncharacterized membrane protein
MIFERVWVLLFAFVPLAWAAREWVRSERKTALVLKLLAALAVLLALAEPSLRTFETRMGVAILVDTSLSVSDEDLARASRLSDAIESARGRHYTRVIPFARSTRLPLSSEHASGWNLNRTGGEEGLATDIEAALREALVTLPAGLVPRIVLISDAMENRGSVARTASLLQQLRVPVDTFALNGRPQPELTIESVTMPAVVFTGESFAVDLTVRSPRPATGEIEIAAEGKRLGSQPVAIQEGVSHIRVHARISHPGAIALTGIIRAGGMPEALFGQTLSLRQPKLLFISQDPQEADRHLLETLRAAEFTVDTADDILRPGLAGYQVVIVNNWDLESLPEARKSDFESYVRQGGGLLVIAGDENIYLERERVVEDPLERALPAKLAPARTPETRSVVLVIDKSASMGSGGRMDLARQAAIGVVENMRPVDLIGVVIFDTGFSWTVPITPAEDRAHINQLISGIRPTGGTRIAPALEEGFRGIVPVEATYKHILLITDGVSEAGNALEIAQQASEERVTISTLAIGTEVSRQLLVDIATLAGGQTYILADFSDLKQVVLRDVLEHTGSTSVEQNSTPIVARNVELLDGVEMETAPFLYGYVRFISKPTADTILTIGEEEDPLLARWQYGLGRSVVFASDAKNRWAEQWLSWPGYDRFWTNVVRDLLPHAHATEVAVEFDNTAGELVVEYRLGSYVEAPAEIPDIFVIGPEGFQKPVEVGKAGENLYRGRLAVGDIQGLFRIRPLVETDAFPEVGLYLTADEIQQFGNDELLLRRVAGLTGGFFSPQPSEIFNPNGRSIPSTLRFWPGLLAFAILLNLIELVLRKWRGVMETLHRG